MLRKIVTRHDCFQAFSYFTCPLPFAEDATPSSSCSLDAFRTFRQATKLLETNIPNAVKAVEKRVRSTEESLSVIMRASTAAATSAEAAATASKAAAAKTVTPTTLKSLLDEFLLGGEQDAQRFVQGLTLRGKDFPGGNDKKSPPRQRASCWGGSEDRLAQGETSAGARVAEPLREQRTRASLRLMKDGNQHIRGVRSRMRGRGHPCRCCGCRRAASIATKPPPLWIVVSLQLVVMLALTFSGWQSLKTHTTSSRFPSMLGS